VACLVLHLGQQDRLALEGGRAADPVALRLHPDDLGVRVLGDLADQRLAVAVGHPVARLDLLLGGDDGVEIGREVAVAGGSPRVGSCVQRPLSGADLAEQGGVAIVRRKVGAVHGTKCYSRYPPAQEVCNTTAL
jgi:hypothetical protein